eukprot:1145880-Pelagomonas_calceolata.AAC.4
MSFNPPCIALSTIGLSQPGKIMRGYKAEECKRHLHQLHVCMPSKEGHTRLLYRMSLDFWGWAKHVPFVDVLWKKVHPSSPMLPHHCGNRICETDEAALQHTSYRLTKPSGRCWVTVWPTCSYTRQQVSGCFDSLPHPGCLQIAGQVLGEDLVLVLGQQARMIGGDDTWCTPMPYDKLAVRYRRWRNMVSLLEHAGIAGGIEAAPAGGRTARS